MKINITKKVGNDQYVFQIDKEKDFDALADAGMLASMPTQCSCGSSKVHLGSNKSQEYVFVYMQCDDCAAKSQLGQYKSGGFFWKKWEKYQPTSEEKVIEG